MTKEEMIKEMSNKPTYREEANAPTHQCLRAGFIEDLHAGKDSEILKDLAYSRITNEEMKKLMIETTAGLAKFLELKDKHPKKYNQFVNSITMMYTYDWEKKQQKYKIKGHKEKHTPEVRT